MLQPISRLPPGLKNITMLDTFMRNFLPETPTFEDVHRTFSNPMEADPRLVAYCYFRPGLVHYFNPIDPIDPIEELDEGEEWKNK